MNATPLWVPLVVAAIGLVATIAGTLAGVLITQRRSDRREIAAREHERFRERERWAREDALRNFEAKRDAYTAFNESLGELERMISDCFHLGLPRRPPGAQPSDSALDPLYDSIAIVRRGLDYIALFAPSSVLEPGQAAYEACRDWAGDGRFFGQPDTEHNITGRLAYRHAEQKLRDAIREDLGVGPPPGDSTKINGADRRGYAEGTDIE
jgi:hypothetical protein